MTARQEIQFSIDPGWDLHRVITAFKIGGLIPQLPAYTRKVKMTLTVEDIPPVLPVAVIVPIIVPVPVPVLIHAKKP